MNKVHRVNKLNRANAFKLFNILNIPPLPNKIWLKIFEYLTYNELKTSTLVSKTWNYLILNSQQFLKRTKLIVNVRMDLKTLKRTRRRYRCVKIKYAEAGLLAGTLAFCANLNQIEFCNCTVLGSVFLRSIKLSTKLKGLKVHGVEIMNSEETCEPLELKLSHLSLQHKNRSTDWIFDHLHCTEVAEKLEVVGLSSTWPSDSVLKFLDRLDGTIGVLKINYINFDDTSQPVKPEFTFRWNCLEIEPFGDEEMIVSKRSLVMKKLCESSLRNSTLIITHIDATEFYKARNALQILEFSANHLSTFEYNGNLRHSQILSHAKIGPFRLVRNLTFHFCETQSEDPGAIEGFFLLFPNVENLSLKNFDYFHRIDMESICSKLERVRSLEMELSPLFRYPRNRRVAVFPLFPKKLRFSELESIALGPVSAFSDNPIFTDELLAELLSNHRKLKSIIFIADSSSDLAQSRQFLKLVHGGPAVSDSESSNGVNVAQIAIAYSRQEKSSWRILASKLIYVEPFVVLAKRKRD